MKSAVQPRQLLAAMASGEPVSGAQLAERLGVTRAAVWKHMGSLRADGLPLEGRSGQGYRLPWPIQLLDADAIGEQLRPAGVDGVEIHWMLDSTSSEVTRRSQSLPDMAMVLAEGQHSGRGRRGRSWLSPPGLNVYLSCLKRFGCGIAGLSGLSLAVGVAVAEAVEDVGVHGIGLKWPNDLLADGAKLAGVLVELAGEFEGPCTAVIGVGINVRLTGDMRADINQPVTDLASLYGDHPPERNLVVARLITHLRACLQRFDQNGFAGFAEDFARRDLLAGQPLLVSGVHEQFEGIGAGVDARGALMVRTAAGEVRVDSAEVSVRAQ